MARSQSRPCKGKRCGYCKIMMQPDGNKFYRFRKKQFCSYSCSTKSRHVGMTIKMAFDKVQKTKNAECLEWNGHRDDRNYGHVFFRGKRFFAHRVSYEINVGKIPLGYFVCHHCDNPPCVNPAHLYAGTAADNSADRVKRGRQINPAGEDSPNAKITWSNVREIRRSKSSGADMARKFGISQAAVSLIRANITWKEKRNG
jgi:HNH endonuclease